MKAIVISALAMLVTLTVSAQQPQTGLEKSNAQRGGQNAAQRSSAPQVNRNNTYTTQPANNPRVNQSNPRVTTPQRSNSNPSQAPNRRPAHGGRPRQ